MQPRSLLGGLFLALGPAVLAWGSLPRATRAAQPGFAIADPGRSAFLSPVSAIPPVSAAAPAVRLGLPDSVFDHNDVQCSIQVPTVPKVCSVDAASASRACSAYCNEDMLCSALGSAVGDTGNAFCSTRRSRARCTVLQPIRFATAPSICSAINTHPASNVVCSIIQEGQRQICTSQNPSIANNQCSAMTIPPGQSHFAECSVAIGGANTKNFCSVIRAGQKTCSTYDPGTICSIRVGQVGSCSHFKGAALGSCSAQGGIGHCSVIGGAAGNRCTLP